VFAARDERPGGPNVVVVGHDIHRSALDTGIDLVGATVRLGGVPHQVIGVMPPEFRFPSAQQLWLPMRDRPASVPREGRPATVFGRLADGVSPGQAQLELTAVHAALAAEFPDAYERLNPEVAPASFMTFGFPPGGLRALPEFYVVQVLTLVPLLIACVNVGLLIFARTARRSSEFAVRTALGASRGRILAQVFTESLVLALLATGAGLQFLRWLPEPVLTFVGFPMPYWLTPDLSNATVLRALGLAGVSALIAGVIPVMRTTSRSVQQNLQRASTQRTGVRFGLASSVMIVADVAVAVAAVGFATGVFTRVTATFANEQTDGIRADRYLSVRLLMTGEPSADDAVSDRQAYQTRFASTQAALVEQLRAEPGVRAVAVGTALPRMDHRIRFVEVEGEDLAPDARGHGVRTAEVAAGFFDAFRSPVLAGRSFDGRDVTDAPSTVVVNTMFVENVLGGGNAIGRRLRYRSGGGDPAGPWHEIVGVVGHLGMHSLTPDQDDGVYHPMVPGLGQSVLVALEVDGDPLALWPRVRDIARDVDSRAVVASPTTLDQVFEGDWYLMGAVVLGATLFVGVLLTLAASGLYAIMSFTVAERTREIGIRVALGADRLRIARQVARRALIQIAIGVLLGLPLAARVFFEMQEQGGSDPSALRAVLVALVPGVGIMVLIGLAACLAPTLRALRISPVDALRSDG
jgi:predicted permease